MKTDKNNSKMVADFNTNNAFPLDEMKNKNCDYFDSNLNGHGVKNTFVINEQSAVKVQDDILDGTIEECKGVAIGNCLNDERVRSDSHSDKTENSQTDRGRQSVETADIHSEPNDAADQIRHSKVPYFQPVMNAAIGAPSLTNATAVNTVTSASLPTTAKVPSESSISPPPTINTASTPTNSLPNSSTSIRNSNSTAVSIKDTNNISDHRPISPANAKDLEAVETSANGNHPGGEDLSVNAWQKISVLICAFVILREFHPIESYFVKYLETLDASYTRDVVRRSIYPVGTYSSLLLMVITFLITDYTRYKPIVILDVLAGLLSYVLILNDPPLPVMWVQQVCIGFYHAGEVSYYSYMYSKIKNKDCYQRATGRVKASIMIGRFLSAMAGQSVVLLFDTAGYKILVYLSILGMAGATIWTFLLPPVEDSVYFHQPPPCESSELHPSSGRSFARVAKIIWADFKTAFSHVEILKWSLWWILGMGGYILVITYNQVLWSSLVNEDPKSNKLMNGAVDAVFTIAGAISTFSIGKVSLNWNRYGEFMLAFGTLIQGSLLVLTYSCHSLKLVYLYYIVFGCIHYTMLTIASSEIAKYLKRESFALVFGFNKFIALLSVSVFTLFIVQIENTPTRTLYLLFGIYFISIGLIYCLVSIFRTVRTFRTMVQLS